MLVLVLVLLFCFSFVLVLVRFVTVARRTETEKKAPVGRVTAVTVEIGHDVGITFAKGPL